MPLRIILEHSRKRRKRIYRELGQLRGMQSRALLEIGAEVPLGVSFCAGSGGARFQFGPSHSGSWKTRTPYGPMALMWIGALSSAGLASGGQSIAVYRHETCAREFDLANGASAEAVVDHFSLRAFDSCAELEALQFE